MSIQLKDLKEPVKTKRKHESAPEDFTNFDVEDFKSFTFPEIAMMIITGILLVICFIQAINF